VSGYSVLLSKKAAKYFDRCDTPTRDRLQEKLEKLALDPFDRRHSKPLMGRKNQRSARVGGFRILFRLEGVNLIVAEIGPRGDIYKHEQ
jgi:mRNA-degrading endonuclease RelE of RelBE toxin-antitoxin system